MDFIQGTILKNDASAKWVQYVSDGDINGCIIYDGDFKSYASLEDLSVLDLPIGLSAMGFIEMGKENPNEPNITFYRKGNMEIKESSNGKFFVGDKQIRFTNEAQEIFDLFDFLPKEHNRQLK